MRIAILGAGVIGVTTAYELSRDQNHEITVIDQSESAATEASAVNAAMIAPGHAFAWASPKVPRILLKSLYRNDRAFRMRLKFDYQFWKWTALFLKQCNNQDAQTNTINKHELCRYSQRRLNLIAQENQLKYQQKLKGLLYLHRHQRTFEQGVSRFKIMRELGHELEVLTPDEVVEIEPAYRAVRSKIAGAIYCPTDETGNAQIFTKRLAQICRQKNVKFRFNEEVTSIAKIDSKISSVKTSKGEINADLFIVCLGAYSSLFLNPIGVKLPIYPVKGYSATFPVLAQNETAQIGTIDEDNLVAITPIGQQLRVTSTAEFAGYDRSYRQKDFKSIIQTVKDLLPNGANYDAPRFSTCFRPMTPKGLPFIGFTQYENLFINSGQGHMGWTMACGSAKVAADIIAGKSTEIDQAPFKVIG